LLDENDLLAALGRFERGGDAADACPAQAAE